MRFILSMVALLALSACATPTTAYTVAAPDAVAMEASRQEQMIQGGKHARAALASDVSYSNDFPYMQRLQAVSERVLIAAAPYCQGRIMQAYPVNVGSNDNGYPLVMNAAHPLRPRDRIVMMEGQPVPQGKMGVNWLNQNAGSYLQQGAPLHLTAVRSGRMVDAAYKPLPACAFNVVIENNNQWNAYADGNEIHVERQLLQDVTNDDELAFVLAHELAHNVLNHVGKQQQNVMAGAALGIGVEAILAGLGGGQMNGEIAKMGAGMGGQTFSQEFEREADYVGLYILQAAGYDMQAGERIARRIAQQNPDAIRYASSHPTSADRAASLYSARTEIEGKIKQGAPLAPNLAPQKR